MVLFRMTPPRDVGADTVWNILCNSLIAIIFTNIEDALRTDGADHRAVVAGEFPNTTLKEYCCILHKSIHYGFGLFSLVLPLISV